MRSLAVLFLCCCLAVSGTASAVPMTGTAMESTHATSSMGPDCPEMGPAVPGVDDGATPVDAKKPDCCQVGGCTCAAAHGALSIFLPRPPSRPAATGTTVPAFGCSGYRSPALAGFIRPPIS